MLSTSGFHRTVGVDRVFFFNLLAARFTCSKFDCSKYSWKLLLKPLPSHAPSRPLYTLMSGDDMSDGVASEDDENQDVRSLSMLLANFSISNCHNTPIQTPLFSDTEEEPVNENQCASEEYNTSKDNGNCAIPENLQLVLWKPQGEGHETYSVIEETPSSLTNDCCSEADSVVLRKGAKRSFPWRSELFSLLCSSGIPFLTVVLEMELLRQSIHDIKKNACRLVYLLYALMQVRVLWQLCRCKVRKLPYYNPPPPSSLSIRGKHSLSNFGAPAPYLSITMVDNICIRLLIWSLLLSLRFLTLLFCIICLFLSFGSVSWFDTSIFSLDSIIYAPEHHSFQQQCQSISQMLLSPLIN